MKLSIKVFFSAASATIALALILQGGISFSHDAHADSTDAGQPRLLTVGEMIAPSTRDLQGSLLGFGAGSVQVLDIWLGANAKEELTVAYLLYIDAQGVVGELDETLACREVFSDLDAITDVYLLFQPGTRTWAKSVTFGVNREGFMSLLGFSGFDEKGEAVNTLPNLEVVPGCQYRTEITCAGEGINCDGTCPAAPPCDCTGTGFCSGTLISVCPGNGHCLAPSTCQISGQKECGCF